MIAAPRRPSRPVRFALAALLGATSLGCNVVVGDYSVVGTHWGCVGSVAQPAGTGGMVTVTLQASLLNMGEAISTKGVRIQACDQYDAPDGTCAPVGSPGTTDASGAATLTVPSGFAGYFDATQGDVIMEELIYESSPIVGDTTIPFVIGSFTADYVPLVTSVGGHVHPGTGAIWVNMEDCDVQPAAGVTLSLDSSFSAGTDPFYFVGTAPVATNVQDETSISTGVGDLGQVAIGGFADVMPGRPTIRATPASSPGAGPYAVFNAYVRVRALTFVWLQPTPLVQ
jgi:hypothetical protein